MIERKRQDEVKGLKKAPIETSSIRAERLFTADV